MPFFCFFFFVVLCLLLLELCLRSECFFGCISLSDPCLCFLFEFLTSDDLFSSPGSIICPSSDELESIRAIVLLFVVRPPFFFFALPVSNLDAVSDLRFLAYNSC